MADSEWDDYEFHDGLTFENSQVSIADTLPDPATAPQTQEQDTEIENTQEEEISTQPTRKRTASTVRSRAGAKTSRSNHDDTDTSADLSEIEKLIAKERKTINRQLSTADLGLLGFLEVREMNHLEIRSSIEKMMVQIVDSIYKGHGFSFQVPSRTNKNQVYVQELDRILLRDSSSERKFGNVNTSRKTVIGTRVLQLLYELACKRIHVTKRDLFYTDVKLFQQQADTDSILEDLATQVGCTRTSLRVIAAEKGVVVGRVQFNEDGDEIDCTKMGVSGKAITACYDRISNIRSDAKFILLIEKDAAFMRLAEDRFYNKYPCILITAKGQPDVATRMFLKRLKQELKLPVLGIVDSDPYGLKILSVYMSGSKNMSYDSGNLTTPDIKWLGVRPSDLDKYRIPAQCRLPMTASDIKAGKELMEEDFIKCNPKWQKELALMLDRKEKAEIQALSNFGFQYLTEVYLPQKIAEGDWI